MKRSKVSSSQRRRQSPPAASLLCLLAWAAVRDPYVLLDRAGRVVVASEGARHLLGDVDAGQRWSDLGFTDPFWPPGEGAESNYWRGRIRRRGGVGEGEEGGWEVEIHAFRRGQQRAWLVHFLATETRQAEKERQELAECRERFLAFMRHLPGVAYLKDLDGRYVFVSESFERHFGQPPQFYLGRLDQEVWPAGAVEELRSSDRLVAETGRVVQTTDRVPQADGVHYWLTTKFPIFDERGAVCMIGGVAVDVTEERRAVEQLRERSRITQQRERLADVGAITAQILHDLANPVAGLSMQVQLLIRRASRDPSQPVANLWPAARQILAEAQRLDALLREFKDFTREQRLELQLLDLRAFLLECATQWRPIARSREITLHTEFAEPLPPVRADGDKLRRVLDNLIRNAVEAIERGPGQILLRSASEREDRVYISVLDDGPGIPHSVDPFRLFETTKPYGTGLGLPIAQQIVQAHGGRIWFERLEPRGTAFHLELLCGGPPLGSGTETIWF